MLNKAPNRNDVMGVVNNVRLTIMGAKQFSMAVMYRAWENIGGLKHRRMANLNQLANKKLVNGLTWFQCKGVTEIIGKKIDEWFTIHQIRQFFPPPIFSHARYIVIIQKSQLTRDKR